MDLLCKWCGESKPAEEFLRRDSKLPYSQSNVRCCRECNAARNRERYKKPDIRARQLKANDKWRKANPERIEYAIRKLNAARPNQMKARNRVSYLLRRGVWTRQPCCICGSTNQVEAHHDSYAPEHWEAVRWLCKEHHEQWHSALDPVKSQIVSEPLKEVESMKAQAAGVLREIRELRIKYGRLMVSAETLELQTWERAFEKAQDLFQRTFTGR